MIGNICICWNKYIDKISSENSNQHEIRYNICNIDNCYSCNHNYFEEFVFKNIIKNNPLKICQSEENGFFLRNRQVFSAKSFIKNLICNDYANFTIKRNYDLLEINIIESYIEIISNHGIDVIEKILEYDFDASTFRDFVFSILNDDNVVLDIEICGSYFDILKLKIIVPKDESVNINVIIDSGFYGI